MILKDLEGRRAEAWIDPAVLHELTYVSAWRREAK